ncbi:MAG: monofunctional biosynthetic peptidoglycan transglycosylase [Pseudomonadota bacterium]|nr:monofunctional biosynthetic peptidoglycan transglycosylase [Pseudomonadota bacterium]
MSQWQDSFLRLTWRTEDGRPAWFRRAAAAIFAFAVPIPILLILMFRFVPIPVTAQMMLAMLVGDPVHSIWVGGGISPALGRAVIAAEDENFCSHHGFDWQSIDKAMAAHQRGARLRGASTISQQAARTIFLLPVRSWVRKGVEAYLTVLIEFLWPKERILTAYLNLVDWGHGNYGAEAAAQAYFHTGASALSSYQAARLAAVLPDPDKWSAARPGPYVAARSGTLIARMAEVTRDGLDSCVRKEAERPRHRKTH